MKKCLKVTKKNILQKRTFTLKLTADDTIAFAFLAAERGITSEQLIESFVRDIVSSFSSQPTIGLSMGSPMEELEKGLKELKRFATP